MKNVFNWLQKKSVIMIILFVSIGMSSYGSEQIGLAAVVTEAGEQIEENEIIYTNCVKEFEIQNEIDEEMEPMTFQVTKTIGDQETEVAVTDGKFKMSEEDKEQKIHYLVIVRNAAVEVLQKLTFTVIYDTVPPKIQNLGIYENENILVGPEETEESDFWISGKHQEVRWKIKVEEELSQIQTAELYRGEEAEALEVQEEYEIPIKEKNCSGVYQLVVKDLAGNVSEVKQFVRVDRTAPVLDKVLYRPEGVEVELESGQYRFFNAQGMAKLEIQEENFKNPPICEGSAAFGKWIYEKDNQKITAEATFPVASGEEKEYFYEISYKDQAGNEMLAVKPWQCINGTYRSERVIVDDRPPVLKEFLVESGGHKKFDQENDCSYAENIEGADVKITVVIDDHADYFCEKQVQLEYSGDGVRWNSLEAKGKWQVTGREHKMCYEFDGEENKEVTYQFRVSYTDRANNKMVPDKKVLSAVQEKSGGMYTLIQKVVIDHQAPEMRKLEFSSPVSMYHGETEDINGEIVNAITDKTTKLYYDRDIQISFALQDAYLKAEDVTVTVYKRENKTLEWKVLENPIELTKSETAEQTEFYFQLPETEEELYFSISYKDRAGNQMIYGKELSDTELGEAYEGGIPEGENCYISPIFVRDHTKPTYTVVYSQEPKDYNCVEMIKTVLSVKEKNLDMDNTWIKISAEDINENKVELPEAAAFSYDEKEKVYRASWSELLGTGTTVPQYDAADDLQQLTLELGTEANYKVTVDIRDKAAQTASYQKSYCIDRTAPEITVVTKTGEQFTNSVKVPCGLLDEEKSDITYSVINEGWFFRMINKLTFGYFAQVKIVVHVKVHDTVSGVTALVPTSINEGIVERNYKLSSQKKTENDRSIVQYQIELPSDFKGTIQMHGIDNAENAGEDTGAIGVISETEKQHAKHAKNVLEILTPYSKTPNYYAGNVEVKFYSEDDYSGLYQVNYTAGTWKEGITYPEGEEISARASKNHTIIGSQNNVNHVALGLEFFDHAGHQETLAEDRIPVVHIDRTKPKIEVTYDQTEVKNEKYYRTERTAAVTVTERNFDPADTRLEVSGPSVSISEWKHLGGKGCGGSSDPADTHHTDDCQWRSTIRFSQDGEYTFTCSSRDLAGNQATYGRTDVFVIDKQSPKIKVTYDNQNVQNGYYYKAPRTATIEISERNFSEEDVQITIMAQIEGSSIGAPKVQGWSEEGEVHRAEVVFDQDGEFILEVAYTDLAGNEAEEDFEDKFVIDLKPPKIEILNIADHSANRGVIAPKIRCADTNCDKERLSIELAGYKNGRVKINGFKTLDEHSVEVQLKDFAHVPEQDDLYTLRAAAYDLAGNYCETAVRFSVNRFGSVFTFDEKTEALVGKEGVYYTKEEPELVVYETNVDKLEFREITWNLNGKIKVLEEGVDYEVVEKGTEESWRQYTYRIRKNNFTEDGRYILTIYSKDRAANISASNLKGKKLEFAVDKKAPDILISGVENKKRYKEEYREVTIDVEDNVAISYAEVTMNGETLRYDAENLAKTDGKILLRMESANQYQTLSVKAYDAAGNEAETQELRFLVSANYLVQYYRNQPLFYGSIGMAVILGAVGWYLFAKNKKRNISS